MDDFEQDDLSWLDLNKVPKVGNGNKKGDGCCAQVGMEVTD